MARVRPDVVLQDVRMPGLQLEALLAAIRARPDLARTPVILFSASLDVEDERERVGAAGTLEKPFSAAQLVGAIRQAVGDASAA
jgi:CheY-like chemotaxis protein